MFSGRTKKQFMILQWDLAPLASLSGITYTDAMPVLIEKEFLDAGGPDRRACVEVSAEIVIPAKVGI